MTMTIVDNQIKTKNGETFDLHYRGLKNDTYSGFLRNSMWPRNCSIAIPKTHGMANFKAIVDQVIDNEDKFNTANTLGRPRYYDILANGVEGLGKTNKIFDLQQQDSEFKTYEKSKRQWYYKTIGGNFNMKSIKINHMKLIDSVSFKELMPFIDNEEIKDVLDQLRRQKFEYQADFLGFCNDLIDATQDTLIASYNKYMKNLFGTHKSLMRHTKEGKESFTYYVYVPKDADLATKKMYESQGRQGIPHNCNIKVVELSLFEENIIVNAEFAKKKQEKLEAVRKYFAEHKRKAAKKAA